MNDLFDDVKTMERFESAQTAELKKRFSSLNEKYQSALKMIESLCVQVETLKSQLVNAENSKRDEVNRLEKECAETRSAFATIMDELKHTQRQKAAITKNRNFWKNENDAADQLYKLEMEENEKLRNELSMRAIPFKSEEPIRIAAAIGK